MECSGTRLDAVRRATLTSHDLTIRGAAKTARASLSLAGDGGGEPVRRHQAPRRGVPVGGRLRGEGGDGEMGAGVWRGAGQEPVPARRPLPAQPHEAPQRVEPRRRRHRSRREDRGERRWRGGGLRERGVQGGRRGGRPARVGGVHAVPPEHSSWRARLQHRGLRLPLVLLRQCSRRVAGTSGMTAYGGFYELCKPKEGEKVFVSAAAGSVGILVGQFAKLAGCYVVGCAGSKAKVDLLKDKLGFDEAFNYREEPDLKSALKRYFPGGIDIYFDHVGGEMLDAAVGSMNAFGRVAVCGAITEYTEAGGGRTAIAMMDVIYRRIKLQGFLVSDYLDKHGEYRGVIGAWIRQGKVQAVEDISDCLESLPSAFAALFRGDNIGKKMVKLH